MRRRLASALTALAALLAVAGCAGPVETRSASSGAGAGEPRSFALLVPPGEPDADSRAAMDHLGDRLRTQGWREVAADEADVLVEVALAARPAALPLVLGGGQAGPRELMAPAKSQRLLQNCADSEHRLVVSLLDAGSGTLRYRGAAAEWHCHGTPAESMAPLTDAALAALAAPGGAHTRLRSGVD